jgi:excinuclease UvrABC helicase subunit UvrB
MKKYIKYIIIFVLLSVLAIGIGYGLAKYKKTSAVIEVLPSTEIIKSYSNTDNLTYSQLSRSPEQCKGKKITIKGTVLQVIENGNDVALRVALNGDTNKVIYVAYKIGGDYKRILENDNVAIMGISNGLFTYQSSLNTDITIPLVNADYVILSNN